jgi:hypothetical protein
MKRQQLPTQKGTQLNPQTTQPPAKLVVKGVPADSPLYRQVAAEFGGRLKSFHSKAQQAYALSENKVMKTRFNWGDARAVYTNIHGQEIIELEVDLRRYEQPEEQPKVGETWWTWALINLTGRDMEGIIRAKAYRRIPAPEEAEQKFEGYAYDQGRVHTDGLTYYSDGMDPFVISYPPHDSPELTKATGDEQVCSLLVDLRRIPKTPVTLDIYAIYEENRESLSWTRTAFHTSIETLDEDVPDEAGTDHYIYQPPTGDILARLNILVPPSFENGGNTAVVSMTEPYYAITAVVEDPDYPIDEGLHFSGHVVTGRAPDPERIGHTYFSNPRWDIELHEPSGLLQSFKTVQDPIDGDRSQRWFADPADPGVNKYTYTIIENTISWLTTSEKQVEMSGIGGFDGMEWVEISHSGAPPYYTWSSTGDLPNEINTVRLDDGFIPEDPDEGDPDGMAFIGTVTIFPVQKSIVFKPATE